MGSSLQLSGILKQVVLIQTWCNVENFQNVWFNLDDSLLRTYFFIRNVTINIETVKKTKMENIEK